MWYGEVTLLVTSLQSVAAGGVGAVPCRELYIRSRGLCPSTEAYCKIFPWWESRGASLGGGAYGERAGGCLGDTAFPGLAASAEGRGSRGRVADR